MIEKLDKFDSTEASIYHVERLYAKVNEIIHELNHILEERESEIKVYEEAQDMYDNANLDALKDKQVDVVVELAKNVQVDEIEQAEKWIGKLCWFSQLYGCHQHIAILKRISESGLYVTDDGELHYAYCEPVKPDDDIIFKGE